jgi:hypothetical protein
MQAFGGIGTPGGKAGNSETTLFKSIWASCHDWVHAKSQNSGNDFAIPVFHAVFLLSQTFKALLLTFQFYRARA